MIIGALLVSMGFVVAIVFIAIASGKKKSEFAILSAMAVILVMFGCREIYVAGKSQQLYEMMICSVYDQENLKQTRGTFPLLKVTEVRALDDKNSIIIFEYGSYTGKVRAEVKAPKDVANSAFMNDPWKRIGTLNEKK